ncbi:MAG: DUF5674 family protein [Acidobacteriota bacterium]
MKVVSTPVTLDEIRRMAEERFGNMVKAVVDVELGVMALDAELHADEEAGLLAQGCRQENLWGINLYPDLSDDEWIEFDSMINLRPSLGNRTRSVGSPEIRKKIVAIVNTLVTR